MSERIQAIRGMNDVLPHASYGWRMLERTFADCAEAYGYREFRTPYLENTALFKRSIGEVTDIVEKEMYTFLDRNGESITLRPEGTAGCVRACLEHGLLREGVQKFWYVGPMFRYEKPQKGRYRQFQQLGLEVFGVEGVGVELELIALTVRFWKMLGLSDAVTLQINTLGTIEERNRYRDVLVAYLSMHEAKLDEDSKKRLLRNPLRILDSKNPDMQELIANAPQLIDNLDNESREHFELFCQGLDALGISYQINPRLVRGLDYYEHTVFEWVTAELGSQATVCAGGRFDRLVEQLGGTPAPAVGFAMGLERLLLLLEARDASKLIAPAPTAYVLAVDQEALIKAIHLAEAIREAMPLWRVLVHTTGGRFKTQFKKADKSGARLALILGEEEMMNQSVSIKDLRQTKEQQCVLQTEVVSAMKTYFE
ncbi:MAG: histidine--tRNA ligase [Gammaproteobacteria bacterium]|nr:histidine--tRNA ligase [Gammaproteobacteria bacterium]